MKRFILALAFVALCAVASDVVQYNPVSSPVPNKVVAYLLSVNTPEYIGKTNYLVITNTAAQKGAGVTTSNLTLVCVVDGQQVRLYNQADLDRIAASNVIWAAEAVIQASNDLVQTKFEARQFATNVITAADGLSLYIRAMGEANWWLLNNIRTNLGMTSLSKGIYKAMVETNINTFGQ